MPTRLPTEYPTSVPTEATCNDGIQNGVETDVDCGNNAALASSSPQLPSSGQHGGAAFLGLLMSMGLVAMAIAAVWRESGEGERRTPPASTSRYGGAT